MNWEAYRINVRDCQTRGVLSAFDLPACIMDPKIFKDKWESYCDEVQALMNASHSADSAVLPYSPG